MRYLLDTNVWIWSGDAPEKIPLKARSLMDDPANDPLGLASISSWEVAKKASIGKLKLGLPVDEWMGVATTRGLELLPLTPEIALASANLPDGFKSDPADEIIVATARFHNFTLITSDKRIQRYRHVKTLWR